MTDFNTSSLNCLPFSNQTAQLALAANTALTYTVPGNSSMSYRCEFSWAYNANVYVGYNVSATVPSAGTLTSNSAIELRPTIRFVRGGDVLSFISSSIVSDASFSLLRVLG
jgi:hypothetical protein